MPAHLPLLPHALPSYTLTPRAALAPLLRWGYSLAYYAYLAEDGDDDMVLL